MNKQKLIEKLEDRVIECVNLKTTVKTDKWTMATYDGEIMGLHYAINLLKEN